MMIEIYNTGRNWHMYHDKAVIEIYNTVKSCHIFKYDCDSMLSRIASNIKMIMILSSYLFVDQCIVSLKSHMKLTYCLGWFMVFNATFNNISVILWWSVLLMEETGENQWPVASHWQTSSNNVISSTSCHERDSNLQLQWW